MPNLLFISYSRRQQKKAIELDNIKLKRFYWWMDYRIVGTVNWWQNICESIEESYCFVALLSKSYTESVFCMGELDYALKLNKPVLCFKLDADATYPKELEDKQIQYISIEKWDTHEIIQSILEALHQVESDYSDKVYHKDLTQRPYLRPPVPIPSQQSKSKEDKLIAEKIDMAATSEPLPLGVEESIIKAIQELDKGQYKNVIDLLEPVRPLAKDNNQETIQTLLREARLGQEYATIAALATSKNPTLQKRGCRQYAEFRKSYPDYSDDQKLREFCQSHTTLPAGDKKKSPPATGKQRIDNIVIERNRGLVYANIKSMADNPDTARGAKAAWKAFERDYPDYDPDDLAQQLEKVTKKKGTAPLNVADPLPDTDTEAVKTDEVRQLAEEMAKKSKAKPLPDIQTRLLGDDDKARIKKATQADPTISTPAAKVPIMPNTRTEPLSDERRERMVNEAMQYIELLRKNDTENEGEVSQDIHLPDIKTNLLQSDENDKIKQKLLDLQASLAEMNLSANWDEWPQKQKAKYDYILTTKTLPNIETMLNMLDNTND